MKTNVNKNMWIALVVVVGNMLGTSNAFSADTVTGLTKKDMRSTVLGTPQQVEHSMQLDVAMPFSHAHLFSIDSKTQEAIHLKLSDALHMALENNIIHRIAQEKVEEALGQKWQSMSALLPHVEASVAQRRTFKENLEAQGFQGFGAIGPFNTFDARLQLTQEVINLSAYSNYQAGLKGLDVARYEKEFSKQEVVLLVSLDYLGALHAQGDFKAAEANFKLSQKLLKKAQDQFQAGIANSVDVARAKTQLAQDELRLAQMRTSVHDSYLNLQRSTGLSYDSVVTLMNTLAFIPESVPVLDTALKTANENRLDLKVSRERIEAMKYRISGVKRQSLPKVELMGDYGTSGNELHKNRRGTGSVTIMASVPLFEGGAIHGQEMEITSQEKQAEIYDQDLRRQVDEDVQKALWLLDTSTAQVKAASHVVGLAERELALSSDRFSQGVGDNVEVVSAQTALAEARNQYVTALTLYHTARINLYFALGNTDAFYLQDVLPKEV